MLEQIKNIIKLRKEFEKNKTSQTNAKKLTFLGIDGFDVYNCSIPINFNQKTYIFGRVEKREIWSSSIVKLFERIDDNIFQVVDGVNFLLEDPFIQIIGGEYILGGVSVCKNNNKVQSYCCNFYRGNDLFNLKYFSSGPVDMKDIRLVELDNNKIGIFSRPRNEEVRKKYGSEAMIGFNEIDDLSQLGVDAIENCKVIENIFGKDEWGGANQIYNLGNNKLGIIGHQSYFYSDKIETVAEKYPCYLCISFIFDVKTFSVMQKKVIATREDFPLGEPKVYGLKDVIFPSGIVLKSDGLCDLYSGLGDTEEGVITIDNPFARK